MLLDEMAKQEEEFKHQSPNNALENIDLESRLSVDVTGPRWH